MKTILVIEDEAPILDNIIDTLQAEEYHVLGAPNGTEGIETAKQHLPDLILCDVMMPGVDGYQVLKQIRADAQTATIPFIFLTAKTERADLRKGMDLGADDYITKPFTSKELVTAIGSRLQRQSVLVEKYEESLETLRKNIVYALPHELRTPLQGIMGFAEVLKLDAEEGRTSDTRTIATHILSASYRLERLIENYLAYAQIAVMATDPELVRALRNHTLIDPSAVVQAKAEEAAQCYKRTEDLVMELYYGPVFRMSESDLAKIVGELVDNAFKFSQRGDRVHLRSIQEDQNYVLYVRDYGRGMKPEQLRDLGAYMQFERTLYEQQGLGMGLVIARSLVDLHGGQMHIKTKAGGGTVIKLSFPV